MACRKFGGNGGGEIWAVALIAEDDERSGGPGVGKVIICVTLGSVLKDSIFCNAKATPCVILS